MKKCLTIVGKLYFDKKWGNTYHSSYVYLDNQLLDKIEYTYGYGDHYIQSAKELLVKHNIIAENVSNYELREKFNLLIVCCDVTRKKDLYSGA